jgi:hypothetical protein
MRHNLTEGKIVLGWRTLLTSWALIVAFNAFLHAGYAEVIRCLYAGGDSCEYPWAAITLAGDLLVPIVYALSVLRGSIDGFVFSSSLTLILFNCLFFLLICAAVWCVRHLAQRTK